MYSPSWRFNECPPIHEINKNGKIIFDETETIIIIIIAMKMD